MDYPGIPHYYALHHIIQCGMKYDKLPGKIFLVLIWICFFMNILFKESGMAHQQLLWFYEISLNFID